MKLRSRTVPNYEWPRASSDDGVISGSAPRNDAEHEHEHNDDDDEQQQQQSHEPGANTCDDDEEMEMVVSRLDRDCSICGLSLCDASALRRHLRGIISASGSDPVIGAVPRPRPRLRPVRIGSVFGVFLGSRMS
ncbi:hypothetical protein V1522DRAFT_418525 [Lipomyces starkeyi]